MNMLPKGGREGRQQAEPEGTSSPQPGMVPTETFVA